MNALTKVKEILTKYSIEYTCKGTGDDEEIDIENVSQFKSKWDNEECFKKEMEHYKDQLAYSGWATTGFKALGITISNKKNSHETRKNRTIKRD